MEKGEWRVKRVRGGGGMEEGGAGEGEGTDRTVLVRKQPFQVAMSFTFGACVQRTRISTYRGTSLIRNNPLLGSYSRTMSRGIWWPQGGGVFLMSEVPL